MTTLDLEGTKNNLVVVMAQVKEKHLEEVIRVLMLDLEKLIVDLKAVNLV